MNQNQELFESMPVPKAVRKMVIPTITGQLIVLAYNIADTFFIGKTNNPDMVAAASLILPVFNFCPALASIAGIGGSSLLSRLLGVKEEDQANRIYSFSIWISVAFSVLFSSLVFFFMDPLLRFLGADDATFAFARAYATCVIVAGALPTIMTNVLAAFLRSTGDSARAGFGITLGGLVNIALDPLFMYVLLPKGQEILGAGIATFLSNCLSCLFFMIVILSRRKTSVLRLRLPSAVPEARHIGKLFAVGLPTAVSMLLFDLDYIVIDRLMSGYTNVALAAVGIVLKAERLPLNIGIGICQGMVPLIAYNYSAGNYKRMREVSRFSLMLGLVSAAVSITLYEIFAPYIMGFFIQEADTVALGTRFLRIRSLATVLMFLSFYHCHLFNGYGRGTESLFLGVTRWAVFNIPMLFLMNRLFGMFGIVWSQLSADVLTVTLSVIVHQRFVKKKGL